MIKTFLLAVALFAPLPAPSQPHVFDCSDDIPKSCRMSGQVDGMNIRGVVIMYPGGLVSHLLVDGKEAVCIKPKAAKKPICREMPKQQLF